MKQLFLNIIILEDCLFEELVPKLEKAFEVSLPYQNKKGRLIAEGRTGIYAINVIDRIDKLGEFLTDEYHVLKIVSDLDERFDYEKIEKDVCDRLLVNKIHWKSGIWSKKNANEDYRRIFPS